MNNSKIAILAVLIMACCVTFTAYHLIQPKPLPMSMATLEQLLDARTPMTGTVTFDPRNILIEVRARYRSEDGRDLAFFTKTPENDRLLRRLLDSGFRTRERTLIQSRLVELLR